MRVLVVTKSVYVGTLAFSASSRLLAAAPDAGRVRVFDLAKAGRKPIVLKGAEHCRSMGFTPDERELVLMPHHSIGAAWDVATGAMRSLATPDSPNDPHRLMAATLSHDGTRFFQFEADEESWKWGLVNRRVADGSLVWRTAPGSFRLPASLVVDGPRNKALITVTIQNFEETKFLDPETGAVTRSVPALLRRHPSTKCAALSPDGRHLALCDMGGIRVVDPADCRVVLGPVASADGSCVAWSPDGGTLASGVGGVVRLWDAGTWRERPSLDFGIGPVVSLAFSPDGLTAAAGGAGRVVLWDLA